MELKESLRCTAKEDDWIKNISTSGIPSFNIYGEDRYVAGVLDFTGAPRTIRAPFARVRPDTPTEKIYQLLTKSWKLERPRLLISVTGGTKGLNVKDDLYRRLANGLLKIAQTPGAWFITGGTNAGATKLVGRILQGEARNCIGIATWSRLENKEDLEKKKTGRLHPYPVINSMWHRGAYLDHNTKQFILVDDGGNSSGAEIRLRLSLECYIATQEDVPSIVLVIEGGRNTISGVLCVVVKTHPTPVVVIKGSGSAADWLAYAIENMKQTDLKQLNKDLDNPDMLNLNKHYVYIKKLLPDLQEDEYINMVKDTLLCLKHRSLVRNHNVEMR